MPNIRYREIYNTLKSGIQKEVFQIGSLLPSEHELCKKYNITRTTARKALDELLKDGFIERQQGKGSIVRERRHSLGLLTVKGFSEAVGENVTTAFLQKPVYKEWPEGLPFSKGINETENPCIFFERLRYVGVFPVMFESNWVSAVNLHQFIENEFIDGSFFKTLSQKYQIEITGSEQELRALFASDKIAELLKIKTGNPILNISIKFTTSDSNTNIYSSLYCNTEKYPVGNLYRH